jgi:DNA-binding GntR family transcriptional regulator
MFMASEIRESILKEVKTLKPGEFIQLCDLARRLNHNKPYVRSQLIELASMGKVRLVRGNQMMLVYSE